MFLRALTAFLVLPGVVGFVVPVALVWQNGLPPLDQPAGLGVLGIGVAALLWCVRDFYVAGKGTLAPWAPPENLVVVGLYRSCRNPMYVAVVWILCGWAIAFGEPTLWAYALFAGAGFHIRVVWFEEPWLREKHGAEFTRYTESVPRWFMR